MPEPGSAPLTFMGSALFLHDSDWDAGIRPCFDAEGELASNQPSR